MCVCFATFAVHASPPWRLVSAGIIQFISPACEEVLGWDSKALYNQSFAVLLTPDGHRMLSDKIKALLRLQAQRALSYDEMVFEVPVKHQDSSLLQMEVMCQAWQRAEVVEIVLSMRPRRRIEA